jgi:preprotein translocase SecE subunit
MATVTKENEENEAESPDSEEPEAKASKKSGKGNGKGAGDKDEVRELEVARRTEPRSGPGFFTIYKKGQGYWTRMGTLAGVALLGVMLAYTLWVHIPPVFYDPSPEGQQQGGRVSGAIAAGFLLIYGFIAIRLMNKPKNVDFLIATDSEMKKVNWTSRRELIGSSKVVIVFMFMIASYLFLNDIIFGYLMYFMKVLKTTPFG